MTIYRNLGNPLENTEIVPWNEGYSSSIDTINHPLASRGVFEIIHATSSIEAGITPNVTLITSPTLKGNINYLGNSNLGFLLWRAKDSYQNNWVLTQDSINDLSSGCFVDQYTTDEIIQNLESITQEFGSNKQ